MAPAAVTCINISGYFFLTSCINLHPNELTLGQIFKRFVSLYSIVPFMEANILSFPGLVAAKGGPPK